jgi:hypothetical protein
MLQVSPNQVIFDAFGIRLNHASGTPRDSTMSQLQARRMNFLFNPCAKKWITHCPSARKASVNVARQALRWLLRTASALAVLAALSRVARADDPVSTSAATSQPVDKWHNTLFDAVPLGQLRDMDTDRPNKTNTPHTIDAGHLQIETGIFDYDYYRDKYQGANARIEALNLGQFNFRLGVLNNLELNAVVNALDLNRNTDYTANQSRRQNGFGDLIVGGKLNLWGNDEADGTWASGLAIQPQFKIPTAREDLGNGHPELFVGIPFLMNLPAQFHLGLQTTVSWERSSDNTADVTGWQNSASIDRVFLDKFDIYLEYASDLSTERHQETQQTLDVGVTYPVYDNIVLDTGVNFGLNRASDTVEWLAGISVRF